MSKDREYYVAIVNKIDDLYQEIDSLEEDKLNFESEKILNSGLLQEIVWEFDFHSLRPVAGFEIEDTLKRLQNLFGQEFLNIDVYIQDLEITFIISFSQDLRILLNNSSISSFSENNLKFFKWASETGIKFSFKEKMKSLENKLEFILEEKSEVEKIYELIEGNQND